MTTRDLQEAGDSSPADATRIACELIARLREGEYVKYVHVTHVGSSITMSTGECYSFNHASTSTHEGIMAASQIIEAASFSNRSAAFNILTSQDIYMFHRWPDGHVSTAGMAFPDED